MGSIAPATRWERSRLADAERINRLLIVCALAYLWLIGLGRAAFGLILARKKSWLKRVYRADRDDRSTFALGRMFMKLLINNRLRIPDLSKLCRV